MNLKSIINAAAKLYSVIDDCQDAMQSNQAVDVTNRSTYKMERVFELTGRGTACSGVVTKGKFHVGQQVYILSNDNSVVATAKIKEIEGRKEFFSEATEGDNRGLTLEGVSKAQISSGVLLVPVSNE